MTLASIPNRPTGAQTRSIADIIANFDAILDVVNGNIDLENIAPGVIPEASASVKIGSVYIWTVAAIPGDGLLLNGQAVSRTTYAALFALWGTKYGVGNGTSTFNVMNLQDTFVIGASGTKALDATGGAAAVTLLSTQSGMPLHHHTSVFPGGPLGVPTAGATAFAYQVGGASINLATSDVGPLNAAQSHENLPPYKALNFVVQAL